MKYDLEYVLNSALDGIFIVAKDQRLVLFNRACEDLFGLSKQDLVNKACWKLSRLKDSLSALTQDGKPAPFGELESKKERMSLPHKNGKMVWVETIYTPIYDQEDGDIAYIMAVIKDITEQKKLEEEKDRLLLQLGEMRKHLESKYDFSTIVGRSSEMLHVLKLTGEVAKQNTTVLILGESGTGKELLAKAIHFNSPRAGKPFMAINCSAFPDTLIESELFGYEKGAFTGAEKYKPGKVQVASEGTLFLDEVTEMSPPAQVKMLRVLQEREFQPLGGVKTLKADIRIIAATNKNIEELVETGAFREDLYYRLNVFPITLPPLRERIEDLPVLIETFLQGMNRTLGKQVKGFTQEAMEILLAYRWPGNVRELQNILERMLILTNNETITASDLPGYLIQDPIKHPLRLNSFDSIPPGFSIENFVRQFESGLIVNALKQCGGNKTRAAKMLGLTRSTLRYKLAQVPRDKQGQGNGS